MSAPIGIGETVRRIIAKAILSVVKDDVLHSTGSVQLCAGQISGVEAAILATNTLFQMDETEAVLLVDANNAFNSLNRSVALLNIRFTCPPLATTLINTYRAHTELFVENEVIWSQEGTTQGDPLAMAFYALSTLPLIEKLPSTTQVWYADDASASGTVDDLKTWWDALNLLGPDFGYFPNSSKTWLVTKPQHLSSAKELFGKTGVNITCEGRPYLGSPLGTEDFVTEFVKKKVEIWSSELTLLSGIALAQPHAAFAAYTHGLKNKWSFLSRTVQNIDPLLQPLELILRTLFIPAITGLSPPNDETRHILALPARCGGLGLSVPELDANLEYESAVKVCRPLSDQILRQDFDYIDKVLNSQLTLKQEEKSRRRNVSSAEAVAVKESLSSEMQRILSLASEKGASAWLTCLPIEEFGFSLHRRAFLDSLALRYGWSLSNTPLSCVCGNSFSISHALSCPRGGFPAIRHNEIRDLTAQLLTEICNDVLVEPHLQPVPVGTSLAGASANMSEGARLDVAMNGFWGGRFDRTFVDVRVFNPHADSNKTSSLSSIYLKHESEETKTV